MEDLIDLIATDSSPKDISDTIKNTLYTKAAERVNSLKPEVASAMFIPGEAQEQE
jgi:hypothetical protein